MNKLVRSSSGFHWWAWRLCWNVWWWWWWVAGSSLREGLWNVLALLGAERSEHSIIMDIRSTQVNVPYNWIFMHKQFFAFLFFASFEWMTIKKNFWNWFFVVVTCIKSSYIAQYGNIKFKRKNKNNGNQQLSKINQNCCISFASYLPIDVKSWALQRYMDVTNSWHHV